jgi:hypothetical protein
MLEKFSVKLPEYFIEWIQKEVDILERKIEFYDNLSFKIKGWSIVSWFGLVSYAITNNQWKVAIFSPLIPILFMVIEASYKRTQIVFMERTRQIMRFLNDESEFKKWVSDDGKVFFPIYDLLNIYGKGQNHDPKSQEWGSMWTPLRKASVSLLYWCLIIASLIVIVLIKIF